MPDITRRLFRRVTLWDASTFSILDLPARHVRASAGPSGSEERVDVASGDTRPTRRTHRAEIPLMEGEADFLARLLARRRGARLQALFLGARGAEHVAWQEPVRVGLRDDGGEARSLSGPTLTLKTSLFDAAIGRGASLLAAVPWTGEDAIGGELTGPDGYDGPTWSVPAETTVDLLGEMSDINVGGVEATLEIQAPIWGASVNLTGAGESEIFGSITFRDVNGDSFGADLSEREVEVPVGTWTIDLQVTGQERFGPSARPQLRVVRPGRGQGILPGAESGPPLWSETDVQLLDVS